MHQWLASGGHGDGKTSVAIGLRLYGYVSILVVGSQTDKNKAIHKSNGGPFLSFFFEDRGAQNHPVNWRSQ